MPWKSGSLAPMERASRSRRPAQHLRPQEPTGTLCQAEPGCWKKYVWGGGRFSRDWRASAVYRRGCGVCIGRLSSSESKCVQSGRMTVSRCTRSTGPTQRPGHNGYVRRFGVPTSLETWLVSISPLIAKVDTLKKSITPTCPSVINPRNIIHAADNEE